MKDFHLEYGDVLVTYGYQEKKFDRFMVVADRTMEEQHGCKLINLNTYFVEDSYSNLNEIKETIGNFIISKCNIDTNLDDILEEDYSDCTSVETFLKEIGGTEGLDELLEQIDKDTTNRYKISPSDIFSKVYNDEINIFDNAAEAIMFLYNNNDSFEESFEEILKMEQKINDGGSFAELFAELVDCVYKVNDKYFVIYF